MAPHAWGLCLSKHRLTGLSVREQGQILDSRELYAPIITPYEAELAFCGRDWDGSTYRLDFGVLLDASEPGKSPLPFSPPLLRATAYIGNGRCLLK